MSSEDALQMLYDNPAVVRAIAILKEHAITGPQYDELVKQMPPCQYDPHGFGCDCYHCLPLRPGISPPPSYDEATRDSLT